MRPVIALGRMTVRQALPMRRTAMLGLIQIAPALIYILATANRTEDAAFRSLVEIAVATYFALAMPIAAIVIGASALGVERRDQTLSFIVLRPMRRSTIVATKAMASIVAAVAISLVGALGLGLAHGVRYGDASVTVGLVVGAIVATSIYVSVTMALGFITDRAVILAMAYLLVFESGVASALPGLAAVSPWRIGVAAFGAVTPDATTTVANVVGTLQVSLGSSLTSVVFVFVIAGFVTVQLLRQRELA